MTMKMKCKQKGCEFDSELLNDNICPVCHNPLIDNVHDGSNTIFTTPDSDNCADFTRDKENASNANP